MRLGRHGRSVVLTRFRELPGGAFGRALERIGARELPLLLAVAARAAELRRPARAAARDRRGLHRPAAADGAGPDRAGPARLRGDATEATRLDDAYVGDWSLWSDARLLAGRRPKRVHHSVSKSSS